MEIESDQERLTRLALRALEEVAAEAHLGPVEHSWGAALALAWLRHIGALEQWNCETFWREMVDPQDRQPSKQMSIYMRTTMLYTTLRRSYCELGWKEPCPVQRGKWTDRYRTEEERLARAVPRV
jgi:hypothetical protein